jgi:hypothetical protein
MEEVVKTTDSEVGTKPLIVIKVDTIEFIVEQLEA